MRIIILMLGLAGLLHAQTLPEIRRFGESSSLGSPRVWDVGDIDGDGRDDVGVTATGLSSQGTAPAFTVLGYVLPSTTGVAVPLTAPSTTTLGGVLHPRALYPVADRDGDGVGDFIAEYPPEGGTTGGPATPPFLRVYSGLTQADIGTILFPVQLVGPIRFATAGDRDGDGAEDYLVAYSSAPLGLPFLPFEAAVDVVDGASLVRSRLVTLPGDLPSGGLVRLCDIDGDAVDDFASGSRGWSFPAPVVGVVSFFSGATGTVIGSVTGTNAGDELGVRVVAAGDITGDGIIDIAALERGFQNNIGRIRFIDATTSTVIRSHVRPQIPGAVNDTILDIHAAGDHDGDGIDDLAFVRAQGSTQIEIRWLRGRDGSHFHTQPFAVGTSSWPIGDANADGFADFGRAPVDQPLASPRDIETLTMMGAQRYGLGTNGRFLDWRPGVPAPARGRLRLSGLFSGSPIVGGVSLAAADTGATLPGSGLPLFISIAPTDLIFSTNETADAFGVFLAPVDLDLPFLAGLRVYVQYAEAGPVPGVSNAVALYFGPAATLD